MALRARKVFGVFEKRAPGFERATGSATNLKGQFLGFAHVQALALAVVNFTVSH